MKMIEIYFPLEKKFDNTSKIKFLRPHTLGKMVESIRIHSGCLYYLTGSNGHGKTTLVNIISALTNSSTTYEKRGKNIILNPPNIEVYEKTNYLSSIRREIFTYVFQDPHIINMFTIEENLTIVNSFFNMENDMRKISKQIGLSTGFTKRQKKYINAILKKFIDHRKTSPYYLSGGEKQFLTLIRALIKPSNIIIADEPWASMDEHFKSFVVHQLALYPNNNDLFIDIRKKAVSKDTHSNISLIITPMHFNSQKNRIDKEWEIPVEFDNGDGVRKSNLYLRIECS